MEHLIFAWILVVHFLVDFVWQTDKMVINKSKSHAWLIRHVAAYVFWMAILAWLPMGAIAESNGLVKVYLDDFRRAMALWLIGNGVLHAIVDAITSRLSAKMWVTNRRQAFFVVMGADQLAHQICLLITTDYVFDRCLNSN